MKDKRGNEKVGSFSILFLPSFLPILSTRQAISLPVGIRQKESSSPIRKEKEREREWR
jgi:hypothetical protein